MISYCKKCNKHVDTNFNLKTQHAIHSCGQVMSTMNIPFEQAVKEAKYFSNEIDTAYTIGEDNEQSTR